AAAPSAKTANATDEASRSDARPGADRAGTGRCPAAEHEYAAACASWADRPAAPNGWKRRTVRASEPAICRDAQECAVGVLRDFERSGIARCGESVERR